MNLVRAAKSAIASGIGNLPGAQNGRVSGYGRIFNAGSNFDWTKYTGLVWENSVVWLALEFYKRNWAEAPLQVQDYVDNKWVPAKDQSLAMALDEPNDWYDGNTLFQATTLSHFSSGNWYWLNAATKSGWPRLYFLWHNRVTPNADGGNWIDNYIYRPFGTGEEKKIDPRFVIHGRNGLGFFDPRVGTAGLAALYRSVASDNLGEIFDGALLHKMGVPGLTFSGKMTPDESTALAKKVGEKFTVDGAGSTLVAGVDLTVTALKATPRDMMLGEMRKLPVGRVCGVFGIDPGVIALPSDTSKHHANFDAMLKAAWTQGIRPVKNDFARTLTSYFRRQMWLTPVQRLGWDFSQVSELQDDRTETADIARNLFQNGVLMRSEARQMVGHDANPEDDVYIEDTKPEPVQMSPAAKKLKEAALAKAHLARFEFENSDE